MTDLLRLVITLIEGIKRCDPSLAVYKYNLFGKEMLLVNQVNFSPYKLPPP